MEDRYLFKAKRLDNGEWEIGSLIALPTGEYEISNKCNNPPDSDPMWRRCVITHKVEPSTICQCTGLKYRNGRLIWENDVVELLGHRGVIKHACGGFGIVYRKNIDWGEIQSNIMRVTGCENILCACENDNFISLWEIYWNFNDEEDLLNIVDGIGNIFDNPELLESED